MATAVLPNDEFDTNVDDNHLGIFCLIWLDIKMNVKDTRNTEQKLQSIINCFTKFQDVKQCQQYIEQRSEKDRLVLIVSGEMGQEMVPSIHKLRQVISIYIYCMDKKRNEEWTRKFAKVKAVVVEVDELISRISIDHKVQRKMEEPLPINIFTTSVSESKSTIGVNGQFVFFQVLIDCLLRLKSTQKDKNELIHLCENEYQGNQGELNNLHEFEQYYSSDKALWWYTRESFFYKTLNAALRTQNIHRIFLFRAFIVDVSRQLQKNQAKTPLRVYRSQLMSSDELNGLKQCIGQFISINSFFSTTTEYATALFVLGDITSLVDLERVLFEIDADPKIVTTKSFADITKHSYFPEESEVLFMLGSIFHLQSIDRNDDQIWIIRMNLCNDDEHDLKQVLIHVKRQTGNGATDLRTLGTILRDMGKLDLAEKYFNRLLEELLPNDPLRSSVYEYLGKLASQRGDYDMWVQMQKQSLALKKQKSLALKKQKSFALKKQNQSFTNPNISETNNSIEFLRGMQAKCFVGRLSPQIRKKMLQPFLLLYKDSATFTTSRIDFLVNITTNFSGAAVVALKTNIIVAIDQNQNSGTLTNKTLLELADKAAREFNCWFGIATLPEICRLYPNIVSSRREQEEYSLKLPNISPSGRILVDLQYRKCLIELSTNDATLDNDLNSEETSTLTLLSRFINGCSSRNIDTIQIIDMNFLAKHNAFDENQIFELLTTTFLGNYQTIEFQID